MGILSSGHHPNLFYPSSHRQKLPPSVPPSHAPPQKSRRRKEKRKKSIDSFSSIGVGVKEDLVSAGPTNPSIHEAHPKREKPPTNHNIRRERERERESESR
jgi:hypothetical protein